MKVNMHTTGATPVQFADRRMQAAYEAECETARSTQSTRFAVAPMCQVATPDGRLLSAGQPITAADLHVDGATPGWRLLDSHMLAGRVLENIKLR